MEPDPTALRSRLDGLANTWHELARLLDWVGRQYFDMKTQPPHRVFWPEELPKAVAELRLHLQGMFEQGQASAFRGLDADLVAEQMLQSIDPDHTFFVR